MASMKSCEVATSADGVTSSCAPCASDDSPTVSGRFLSRILIAIPLGLLLWAGLMQVAGAVLHRL